MIKLRPILQSKYLYLFIIILTSIYSYFYINNYKSIYTLDTKYISGTVTYINSSLDRTSIEVSGKELIQCNYKGKLDIKLGDHVKLTGTINDVLDNTNFNLFSYKKYLMSKKISYTFNIETIEITNNTNIFYKIKNDIIDRVNSYKSYNYLNTFVLGNKNYLEDDIYNSYQINGVSHLLAISGMHVSFLASTILFILNKIKKTNINYIVVILFLLFYSFLTNFTPSILRSFFLFTFLFINKLLKLNIKTYNILIIIASILIINNPFNIYNIGFLFSFTISLFLIVFGSITNSYKNYFIKLFITSLISNLASIPILINNFYYINILSVFNNLLFVPIVTYLVFPLSLITLIIKPLDGILLFLTNIMDKVSLFLCKYKKELILCHIPWYIVILYYILIIFILYQIKRNKYYYLVILLIVLLIHNNINYVTKYNEIHMIDIGQGDSILIKLRNNYGNILIDTGGSFYSNRKTENVIIPYLKSIGVKELDYLVITHGDIDHIGGSEALIKNFKVDNVLLNSGNNNAYESNLVNNYNGKNISIYNFFIKDYEFKFINELNENENEDGLVLYTNIDNYDLLFMADVGIDTEKRLINEYNLSNMDILKIGHHGSKYSSSYDFLKEVNPKISLISAGRNNRFNHPNKETIDRLNSLKLRYYLTSINGSIKLVLKDTIDIYTRF